MKIESFLCIIDIKVNFKGMNMKTILLVGLMMMKLSADYTLSYQFEEDIGVNIIETIHYKDDKNIKLSYHYAEDEKKDPASGLYVTDGKHYSVENDEGNITYRDIKKDQNLSANCQAKKEPFFKVLKKLGKEYIADFEGEVWLVESEEDGIKEEEKIIVCNDKDIVRAVKSYFDTMRIFGEGADGQEFDAELESMFMVADGYVLIAAKGIELITFDEKIIPSTFFNLPKNAQKYIESEETEG
jgi:hypothetical protein